MAGNIFYFFFTFNSLAEYKNLDSKIFSCSTLKILICCLLKSSDDTLRMKMILICFLFCFGIFFFSLRYVLPYWKFLLLGAGRALMFLISCQKNVSRCVFFCIILGTLSFCGLEFFLNSGKFSAIISSKISFISNPSGTPFM